MMEKNAKIYVAGHRGMVGSAIVRELQRQGYTNIITRTHKELDLTRQDAVEEFFAQEKPEYVFLAAAKVGGIVANQEALNAGHQMNYHSHQHRDEVWTVIAGKGKTIVDGMEQNVKAGDVITMSAGCRHTVIAETELKLIEVQLGEAIDVHDKQKFELEY